MNVTTFLMIVLSATAVASANQPVDVISADWQSAARRVASPEEATILDLDAQTLELTVTSSPASPWLAQLALQNVAEVRAGDVLLVEFECRAVMVDPDTQEAALQIVAQMAEPPYTVDDDAVTPADHMWRQYEVPLRAVRDYAAGELQFAINFGVCRQRVLLRGLAITNLGKRESIAGLRQPPLSYAGREADAAWRKSAGERIEQIRKAELTVSVVDGHGKPLPGALVKLEQRRHAFAFGTAVTKDRILGTSVDDQKYRQVLRQYFNTAVFENDLKWPAWEQGNPQEARRHREQMQAAINWLRRGDDALIVRGHCLVWPELQRLPPDVQQLVRIGDGNALRRRTDAHVSQLGSEFAGQIDDWDVVNEPTFHQSIQGVLGEQELARWFDLAHKADPKASLYLNDFAMLSYGALNPQKTARMYDLVKSLRDQGAPIHGIGEQAHFGDVLVSPARVIAMLDRFATLGLPIRITEFDVALDDEQLQADYLRDFFTAAFSHPGVNGIVLWGFYQGNHWKPQAALWKRDWSRRPLGDTYVDLIEHQWHTSAAGTSDAAGRYQVRGFLGEYEVTVQLGDRTETIRQQLTKEGASVTIRLP